MNRNHFVQLAAALAALPMLYLAAGGPILRYSLHHPAAAKTASALYDPVSRLFSVTPLKRPWAKYLDWWGVELLDVGDEVFYPFYVPRP